MKPFCKKINLDFHPLCEPPPVVKESYELITFDYDRHASQQLKDFCAKSGIVRCELHGFYKGPHRVKLNCHIDSPFNGERSRARINWVYGGAGSFMEWYDVREDTGQILLTTGVKFEYMSFPINNYKKLHTEYMQGPYIVETAIAHVVHNPGPEPRWAISIVPFFKDHRCTFDDLESITTPP
jgi:hypothetical protein